MLLFTFYFQTYTNFPKKQQIKLRDASSGKHPPGLINNSGFDIYFFLANLPFPVVLGCASDLAAISRHCSSESEAGSLPLGIL